MRTAASVRSEVGDTIMASLERAIALAAQAHEGQVDKAGAPYILHPLRVMLAVNGTLPRIVAVLHDVLEDTALTPQALKAQGFSDEVLDALMCVTRRDGESYEAFVQRCAQHPTGRVVKLADLRDNADLSRIPKPGPQDLQRQAKYLAAIRQLEQGDGAGLP